MPPRIRSPTPESEEEDQLAESPRPTPAPAPASTSAHASTSGKRLPAPPLHQADQDDDELSSLSEDNASQSGSEPGGVVRPPSESDDESPDEDEPAEDDDEFAEPLSDEYDDDDDEEMDELYDGPPPPAAASSKKAAPGPSMKIKFKLGGGGPSKSTASQVTGARSSSRASAVKWTPSAAVAGSRKGKGKKKKHPDDLSDFSDDEDDDDHFSDSGDSAFSGGQRLTARQRAKEMGGEFGMELQSLSNAVVPLKPPVKLTEAELALRRSENSRKRKHQSDKKLEDEKTETINRLLKKQVGKQRSKLSTSTTATNPNNQSSGQDGVDGDVSMATTAMVRLVQTPATAWRWVSSIKSGEYVAAVGILADDGGLVLGMGAAHKGYPGPRPPLKTRKLV